ncbi:MAG: PP2C family serine/threonine-protein phosphatase [Planctomycetaceae bacterium]|nr:PP2C family serine/threonine-protein phosphatase [Planctomycetaceae bacterium]
MWKLVFGSVQGTSHVQSGMPCQDYCAGAVAGTTLVAACADGAGSAELSQLGSKAAVDRFMEVASGDIAPTKEQVEAWVDAARARLLEEAVANESTPRRLACTFLAALVGDGWAAFAQVGDGVIVFNGPDGYDLAFWPDNGEYANTTRFLSEDDYQEHLRVEIIERHVSELALLTDGLQMLALDVAGGKVHDRFFAPLFKTVRNGPDEAALHASLLQFMDSKRVNERTDDDKTLILATRITADVPPNLPDATA